MPADDALSLLRAGLDEDERIARASGGDEWIDDDRFNRVEVAEGYIETSHHGPHIARQCPKATLDRVEAIRKVIARRDQLMESVAEDVAKAGEDSLEYAVGVACVAALNAALADLASIYAPEPAETGEPT